ncbi:MAG: AsmA family protein [Bacteroidales bacterium]|nr:AsmA family protein [Bacteroidales bacterium]
MKKFLKRLFWITVIVLILFIAAAIVIPIIFKPQLMEIAKTEINRSVNAKVEFSDFQVSLIKGFPNLYIGLKDMSVVGIDSFSNDTLVAFAEFSVKVNLWSVIDMQNIEVKSILLDGARLKARIAEDGQVNWDIAKPSATPETEVEDTAATSPINTKVALTKFEIRNANIAYIDDSSRMAATIHNFNLLLSGNMGMSQSDLLLKTSIEAINFTMGGLRYVKDANMEFNATIGANLDSSTYTFKDNMFRINQLALLFEGMVKMPGNDIEMDIKFNTPSTEFKAILSMVPAIYMKDFDGLKTSGKFGIDGFVKGVMNDSLLPNASIALLVENGMFQYPALPKSVSNVNISTKVWFDGSNMDSTTVDVDRFHLELGSNPFDASLHVATPISDMQVAGNVTGKIDFATLADVVPLDSTTITGMLEANLDFAGKLSYIETEDYEKFKADGSIRLTNFAFTSNDLPQGFKINETLLNFSPRYVDLAKFDSQVGKSDLQMTGRLENFIPFVFKDQTVRGNLNLTSAMFDVNEFMTGESTPEEQSEPEDTSAMSVIEVPRNINFNMKTNFAHIIYDKLDISNLKGDLLVNDGIVDMKNLSMNLLEGSMVLGGRYNSQNVKAPKADMDFNMKDIDIPSAFNAFSTLQKMAPAAKDMTGKVSAQFKLDTPLDTTMMPVMNSINAYGKLQSNEIGFKNSKVFGKVADALKNDKYRNPSLKDVNVSFKIKDGRIYIEPFDTKLADINMNIGGDMGIDQTLDFKGKLKVPASYLGSAASDLMNKLADKAGVKPVDDIKVNLKIGGTSTDPKVGLDWGEASSGATGSVKETISAKVDEVKAEVRKEAKAQAEKLIADAEKEAARIREEAAILADKIRKEAEAQALKTEAEGKKKGPIAERLAKETAKKIRQNGETSAQKVISEADIKANQIIEKAKAEAAKL